VPTRVILSSISSRRQRLLACTFSSFSQFLSNFCTISLYFSLGPGGLGGGGWSDADPGAPWPVSSSFQLHCLRWEKRDIVIEDAGDSDSDEVFVDLCHKWQLRHLHLSRLSRSLARVTGFLCGSRDSGECLWAPGPGPGARGACSQELQLFDFEIPSRGQNGTWQTKVRFSEIRLTRTSFSSNGGPDFQVLK
jgi:hypothetical protein